MIKIAKKYFGMSKRLDNALKNVRPKTRKIIIEEITKIKKKNQPKRRPSKNPSKTKKKRITQKPTYLVNLKREQAMASKGWKVVRTKNYLELPKKAIGKEGYPYAVLNKNQHYETFYTWKEKPAKIRKQKEKFEKKVQKRIKKGKDIGWGW